MTCQSDDTTTRRFGIPTLAAVVRSTGVAANGIGFAISSNQMEKVISPYIPSGS
jgi:hypothetical protein